MQASLGPVVHEKRRPRQAATPRRSPGLWHVEEDERPLDPLVSRLVTRMAAIGRSGTSSLLGAAGHQATRGGRLLSRPRSGRRRACRMAIPRAGLDRHTYLPQYRQLDDLNAASEMHSKSKLRIQLAPNASKAARRRGQGPWGTDPGARSFRGRVLAAAAETSTRFVPPSFAPAHSSL